MKEKKEVKDINSPFLFIAFGVTIIFFKATRMGIFFGVPWLAYMILEGYYELIRRMDSIEGKGDRKK